MQKLKSITTHPLQIIGHPSFLHRCGCGVQTEMGWKLLGAVIPRIPTASLKIMPACELSVRGSVHVSCLLKKSETRKTAFEHNCAHAYTQTLSVSVLHFTVSKQQTKNDTSQPILCFLTSRWMFLLCFASH